jgi:hypothetical protein
VSIFKPIALASALAFQSAWSPASAANVYGIGSIDTNLGFPLESFDADYEAPDFLDVAKIIQLNGSEAGGNIPVGNKSLSYFGDARFGRLSARSHIGGQVPASPDLSTSVQVSMGFSDQIAVQNLNPLAGNNLRLDVALGGEMTGYGATDNGLSIGKLTSANFSIRIADLEYTFVVGMADIGFAWFGPNFLLTNTSQNTSPRFTPYPGEEPGFTQNPTAGPPSHFFGTRGYIDIPLFYPPFLALGESFVLEVDVTASSSCGNETPECLAITRFSTAYGSDRQCAPRRSERRRDPGSNLHLDIRIRLRHGAGSGAGDLGVDAGGRRRARIAGKSGWPPRAKRTPVWLTDL